MMAQDNESIVRAMLESVLTGDTGVVDQYISPNWENHDPSLPPMRGREGARQLLNLWSKSFSELNLNIENIFSSGEWVGAHFSVTGRHTGDFQGIPATGKSISLTGTGVFRCQNGQLTDNYVNFDALGLLQQLGVVPMPGQEQRRAA